MTTTYPVLVAYMTVSVPVQRTTASALVDNDDAKRIVQRYLYGNWSIVSQGLDADAMIHEVVVRYESTWEKDVDLIQMQRDRFASGMYGTTEPVVLTA